MFRLVGLTLLAACSFSPSPVVPGDDQPDPDAAVDDAADDIDGNTVTADARQCFGTGLVQVCLSAPPSGTRTLPGSAVGAFDTGVDANCAVFPQTNGDELCVIAAETITVDGAFTAIGKRPLVLIGATSISVTGSIDVSSNATQTGAGANHATICAQATFRAGNGEGDSGGGGGGAGGGFATRGATGGLGDNNDNHEPFQHKGIAGVAGTQQALPTVLRGGCPGGAGGGGTIDTTALGGNGGNGGGAVYLIAGEQITITGNVFASGGGGRANSGNAGFEQGGGGGGSGGMIGIDAPAITIDGIVAANGGAGAGGGGTVGGAVGGAGSTVSYNTRAVKGLGDAPGSGGNGTDGTCVGATTTATPPTVDGGAGGGGGGIGVVWIDGAVGGTQRVSPAPTAH